MGVYTVMISRAAKEWCDLGKIFLDEPVVDNLRAAKDNEQRQQILVDAMTDESFNNCSLPDAAHSALEVSTWLATHPDWEFIIEADEMFDDIYLAQDDEDATEYQAEFPEADVPIFKKTGDAWPDLSDENDEPDLW